MSKKNRLLCAASLLSVPGAAHAHGGIEMFIVAGLAALAVATLAGGVKWGLLRLLRPSRYRPLLLIPAGLLEIVLLWLALFLVAQLGLRSFFDVALFGGLLYLPLAHFPNLGLLEGVSQRRAKALLLALPFPLLLLIGQAALSG